MINYSNNGEVILYNDKVDVLIKKYTSNIAIIKTTKRIDYLNIPSSFDIETSSFYENGEKRAIMYEWTFGINGLVIIGRTWEDFISLCNKLFNILKINEKKRLLVYVHNLAFEFQFICKRFNWLKVFANDERKPLYALSDIGIEFRCSYMLSGFSLAKVGEHLQKYKVEKMVGDLDYKLIRNSKTKLSDKELKYCINDVRVVMSYIQELIEQWGDISKLPLTKTGFVRNFVRKKCFHREEYGKCNTNENKKLRKNYNRLMKCLQMDEESYLLAKRCFMGGFTHASLLNCAYIFENVHSYDFTSSYPYVMISNEFPMSKGKIVSVNSLEEYKKYAKSYCCAFDVEFTDIESTSIVEHYIPISKCFDKRNYEEDNGRLMSADMIKISITNVDMEIIRKFYNWKSMRFANFRIFVKNYLPREIILAILDLYETKTKLKNVENFEKEYNDSKEMLNSCYGMCVTDIAKDNNEFLQNEWTKKLANLEEVLEKYNKSRNRFLFYWWGIFIPSYARRNLFYGINELQEDYIYSDTDSLKFLNLEKHKKFFDMYNQIVEDKLKRIMNKLNIPFEKCKPKTIEGKEKLIGVFDYEGKYDYFKTLGAKRYMYVKDDKISLTISGVNKKSAIPYLCEKFDNDFQKIFDYFNEDMFIPKGACGKQIHTYIDYETEGDIEDYQGNIAHYHELSSTHLEESEYCLSLSEKFRNLLLNVRMVKY